MHENEGRGMPGPTGKEDAGTRLVLGFDGGCSACGELARRIEEQLGGRLEVLSLHEARVVGWREETLGEGAPLVPTLFEVRGQEALRAWTGWRLGARLSRALGPTAAWQVVQVLGEGVGEPRSVGAGVGLTRGQFLKGVGGVAVAMSALSATGGLVSPARAQAVGGAAPSVRASGDVVGASILHPAEWSVQREEYIFEDTYGFTLWKPEPGASQDAHNHGGEPAVRIARARGLRPKQVESRVRARLEEYSHLSVRREAVTVGEKKYKGVAVGPIPGSTPSIEVYVPVENRVYQINVYGETLNAEARRLLSRVRFSSPSRSVDSLGLEDAGTAETFQTEGEEQLVQRERSEKATARASEESSERMALASYDDVKLKGGCWQASSAYFFQTQHGAYANRRWGSAYYGWTIIGRPNYWGQYTHGDVGYGRCNSTYYTNDIYAIDYPLGYGDVIFSPFKSGTVTFAGRNYTHKDYGIFVVIKADNGKYVNLSAHLGGLASGIRRGARVTDASIIGYAGNTGGSTFAVGEPHLHQAYYRYPRYHPDGSPYGGAALQVVYHRYTGTASRTGPGYYKFGWVSPKYGATCRQGISCGEGYWISN